jgi:AcrR family transcriptional regulator
MSSKKESTRNRILGACLHLLEQSQGKGVRMSDIAKQTGISRQAVYLHFSTRAELLIETTLYLDRKLGDEQRLLASRTAKTGIERLDAYIEAWASYVPEIYGIAKAFMAMRDHDVEAASAWDQRMQDMREGCEAAIRALKGDKMLNPEYTIKQATDLLWMLLSIRNWELLTMDCGWSRTQYCQQIQALARRSFVAAP